MKRFDRSIAIPGSSPCFKRQLGLTLIETLISLAILALITFAATQALQRASLLKDKIDSQSESLQAQFTLEQLISRDILNSEALIWPSSQCPDSTECFELKLQSKVFQSIHESPEFIRYRFDNGHLYRDQARESHEWQSIELKHKLKSVRFSVYRQKHWQSVLNPVSTSDSNSDALPDDAKVNALRIDWHPEDMSSYQQTVMLP
ncbi:PulJ/GspJ family protein [Pseudoteredinibacter isoporae]|uniref:Prepilin-type N-terminal cleavage/methylation domain-containing protein n=1 Tax=Pseudoteredinibacter isoporae TaxID=570281 RepID=A0A7X0MVM4_9GAMM|nr:type II secretion system protein [Pseudoteredinibacter isoporae]MBB6521553.1 prepilin-type N-terminal cleavage/methylation domain-containing protein [Pseudoteredinibacter isoporae]NHO87107.1 type II secretion system protein [Pseudoteredinibacter isoporae]NIB22931.1 type II secretion system protein [Pseudoteredinibacter isoporae]